MSGCDLHACSIPKIQLVFPTPLWCTARSLNSTCLNSSQMIITIIYVSDRNYVIIYFQFKTDVHLFDDLEASNRLC